MEGRNLTPDSNFAIVYPFLFLLLPPLVFSILFLLSFVKIHFVTMDPPKLPVHPFSEREDNTDSTDSIHSTDKATTSVRSAPPSHSPTPSQLSNILDSALDDIQIPILQPVVVHHRPRPVVSLPSVRALSTLPTPQDLVNGFFFLLGKTMASLKDGESAEVVPWDGKIQWAIKGCSVFDNSNQEFEAMTYRPNLLSRQRIHDVWIFQYGVRYIPSSQEKNIYRTVRIQGLPANMKLSQVLPSIPGEIYCARLVNTRPIIGSNTAIVTFVSQVDAVRFIQASNNGLDLGLVLAQVIPVNTPTYPMPVEMERMIFDKNNTRCLCVYDAHGSPKESISRVLMKPWNAELESIEEGHLAGEVYVRFHSIKAAAAACEFLKGHTGLCHCKFRFLKQFCALPPSPVRAPSPPSPPE
ncbi:uncharacterized protein KD926_010861 [Aspergillus affinis]|uniref:uncharacterized protein n=1 Tax=Aspergillus affinis TaxID=1070780 RepID=UPI0022FF2161|nr:uncharacterized protein KD926_010861 [Aspergillus affinis]KAI9038325.1 hypothetical protein KD926_010861 [Aspergillus affinis]